MGNNVIAGGKVVKQVQETCLYFSSPSPRLFSYMKHVWQQALLHQTVSISLKLFEQHALTKLLHEKWE